MLDFKLLPGDKYDGRCAEIYITEKQFLIYHCSMCEEIYTTFNELLSHIIKKHYENIKEYSTEAENKSVEIISLNKDNREETQLAAKKFVKTEESNKQFDSNFEIANSKSESALNGYQAQALETVSEIPLLKVFKETEVSFKFIFLYTYVCTYSSLFLRACQALKIKAKILLCAKNLVLLRVC